MVKQLDISIPKNLSKVIVAYEPIWSIGTGLIPSRKEIDYKKSKLEYICIWIYSGFYFMERKYYLFNSNDN